uniref:PID domain-containing protein n=1 Tax=Globodera rostochiensis TaxID=31243 RepID=A0A914HB66_GLORO
MEVYKTIKRSFSATANGIIGGGSSRTPLGSAVPSNGSFGGRWIHPPACLCRRRGIERGKTGHSGAKHRKVVLQISVNCVNVLDAKTRAIIVKHHISRISFCADDQQDKRLFSYIARNEVGKYQCFVFLSDKMAENITLTVGQAFDLAYEKQVKKRGRELTSQKHELLLRKKIAELEEENRLLKHRVERCTCSITNNGRSSDQLISIVPDASSYPSTSNWTDIHPKSTGPPPLPLAPPPRRTSNQMNNPCTDLLVDIFGREHHFPPIQQTNVNDLFDDDFDPRADEKKLGSNDGQKGEAVRQSNTVEQFEALLRRVDKQLAEVQDNMDGWNLERGDTGDLGRDWSIIEDEEQQKEREEENIANECQPH